MIGMEMRIDRLDQPQIELVHELNVTVHFLEDRIDDQGLSPGRLARR